MASTRQGEEPMRISSRTEYGILAMVDLAEHAGLGPIGSHEIAERQDVPEPYLNQILTLLRKAGLIGSRRGPGGGHALARAAIEITLADIVAALEGPLWIAESTATSDGRDLRLSDIWGEVDSAIYAILQRITLADLVERSRRKAYSYQI